MARPPVKKEEPKHNCDCLSHIETLASLMENLINKVAELEYAVIELQKPKERGQSINRVESFNGEQDTPIESYVGMKMLYEEKIQSIKNATMILPPNLIKDGKHNVENIQAIVGFAVTDEMLDDAYKGIVHEGY